MPELSWEQVRKRKDLVGGDVEWFRGEYRLRGPLSKIELSATIQLIAAWLALCNPATSEWTKQEYSTLSVPDNAILRDTSEGKIIIEPERGLLRWRCVLFPKGGEKLDPLLVKGLPKASERLLAHYPDLEFDVEIAHRILLYLLRRDLSEALTKMPEKGTLSDLLAKFTEDKDAERFLLHYIPHVTDVSRKVY